MSWYVPASSFSTFVCGVIVTNSVSDGVVPVVGDDVPDSGPVAVAIVDVLREALAPEKVAAAV